MTLVVAHIAASQPEAAVTVSALEAADIPAFAFDKATLRNARHMDVALGGIRIMVPESRLEDAVALLGERAPSTLESETEAFRRERVRGPVGLIVSFLAVWFPWWTRTRRFRDGEPTTRSPQP